MDFLIGHPRSGTMFASHLFNAGRAGVSVHELLWDLSYHAVWAPSEYYAGRLDAEPVARLLDLYRHRPPATRIDCNWKLTWILPVLLERHPEARIVHLVREPRENIRSCFNLDYYGALWAHPEYQTSLRRNYWLHWMPRIRRDDWEQLSQLERNCAFWTETHRLALEAEALGPRYLRVRVEDLDEDAVLDRLLRFLELPRPLADRLAELRATRINTKHHEKREIQSLRPETMPPPAEWPRATLDTVERLCGTMARRLGYVLA